MLYFLFYKLNTRESLHVYTSLSVKVIVLWYVQQSTFTYLEDWAKNTTNVHDLLIPVMKSFVLLLSDRIKSLT